MRTRFVSRLVPAALSLSLLIGAAPMACKQSTSTPAAAQPGASAAAPGAPSAPAARPELRLAALNLRVDAPADSLVSDGMVPNSVMVNAAQGSATIGVATETTPRTLAAAQQEAQMFTPTNVHTETLADGWVLTFENTGGMGTNYWLKSLRTIGGRAIYCDTTATTAEQRTYVAAMCRSLRP